MRRVALSFFLLASLKAVAAPTRSVGAKEKEARTLFEKARAEHDTESVVRACALWEDAFALSEKSEIKFSLGVCYAEAGKGSDAEAAYREFLAYASPKDKKRQVAEQALAQLLEEKRAKERATPTKFVIDAPLPVTIAGPLVPTLERPDTQQKTPKRAWLLWCGGLGAGAFASTVVFFVVRGVLREPELNPIPETELR